MTPAKSAAPAVGAEAAVPQQLLLALAFAQVAGRVGKTDEPARVVHERCARLPDASTAAEPGWNRTAGRCGDGAPPGWE